MKIMVNIAIVLINYKQPELTIDCIKSIRKSTYKQYEIIVVDNNSGDNSCEVLGRETDVTYIQSAVNDGFSSGNNIGIKYAKDHHFDAVMLLNNDTVIAPDMIEILIKNYSEDKIFTPSMMYYSDPDKIWFGGGHIDFLRAKGVHEHQNEINVKDHNRKITFSTGCCMLIPMVVIDKMGMLDDRFFMYCEDLEYSLRAYKQGITIDYIPDAKLWHKVGASSAPHSALNVYYDTRNRLMIMKEYKFSVKSYCYVLSSRLIRLIQGIFKKNNNVYIWKGLLDYLKGKTGKAELV